MALFVAGLSHKNAPVELREQLAVEEDKLRELLSDVSATGVVQETLILSTCNRVEVYGVADAPGEARAMAFRHLCRYRGLDFSAVESVLHAPRRRGRPPRLPRGGQPGLDDDRRAADPGAGEGRLRAGPGLRDGGAAAPHAFQPGLRRGQARADGDGDRAPRGVGVLRGRRAGQEDLRGARPPGRAA